MAIQNPTTNYSWTLPTVGASVGTWGTLLNTIFGDDGAGSLDSIIKAVSDVADAALPKAGGTMTGALTVNEAINIENGSARGFGAKQTGDAASRAALMNDGSLRAGGDGTVTPPTVITSAGLLQNVTANTSILTAGTLGSSRGGTGVSAPTSGNLLVGAGSSAMTELAPGAAGGFVRSNGSAWVRSSISASDVASGTFADGRISESSVTQHQAALAIAASQLTGTIASARLSGSYTGITAIGTLTNLDTGSVSNVGGTVQLLANSVRLPKSSSNPSTPTSGDMYYNTTSNEVRYYDGSSWVALTGGP